MTRLRSMLPHAVLWLRVPPFTVRGLGVLAITAFVFALFLLALIPVGVAAQGRIRVVVEPAEVELQVDGTARLTAEVFDADGTQIEGASVIWVARTEVLTLDAAGVVTAHRPGVARVTAVYEGVPGFATVRVAQLPAGTVSASIGGPLLLGTSRPIEVEVRTDLGERLPAVGVRYESSAFNVARVDGVGRVTGVREGRAVIRAWVGEVSGQFAVDVKPNPSVWYRIDGAVPGESVRTGDVVRLRLVAERQDGTEVEGLEPHWSLDQPGGQIEGEGHDGVFVAEEPGTYIVTASTGPAIAHSVALRVEARQDEARLIKVGRGPIATHHSGDTWVFTGVDGHDYAYIGTFVHDWMKVWDVTDPSNPVLTDSVQVDARRINDVKIHPNNRLAIITREGASSRRNGIVLLDLSEPAHPVILSEYTETVTGGVHNVWIRGEEELVYACHNGTSELHILDISDPSNPSEVGRWGIDAEFKTLHDVIVQDGYAYLSYWDDGVITLDVGAGTHGGTPTEPTFVSQFKYPIGNTHVAWRHGRYLFVGDEIFPDDWDADSPIEARGYIHVLDMTDMDNPVEVARYEVPEAGAHNVWTEGDRLYVGYYQGGLRVLDISGELRGDLYRQGREMAVLKTTDANTTVPNWPMTWGAQLFKGNIYTSDLNSGLWIARLVETELVP